MNILFVCTGNTCRSPMAEGYLNYLEIEGISVKSRGIAAYNEAVSENSLNAMQKIGIDISSHTSKQITDTDILWADKIICMSTSHKKLLEPFCKEKLQVLGEGIGDPFGQGLEIYEQCRDEIIYNIDKLFIPFAVRPILEKDIGFVAELEKICFNEPWSETTLKEAYQRSTRFFVCEIKRKIVGYIGINCIIDEGYITNVAVLPEFRNKGIATALLKSVFDLKEETGLEFISLEVRPSNKNAISLYEKMGFVIEGKRKNFYSNPLEDALIMTKRF